MNINTILLDMLKSISILFPVFFLKMNILKKNRKKIHYICV